MLTNAEIRNMAEKMLLRACDRAQTQGDHTFRCDQLSTLGNVEVLGVTASGNFTVVTVDVGGAVSVGVAKRNPLDTPDPQRGARLAASRALKRALAL